MTLTLVDRSRLSKTQKQKAPQLELHSPSEPPPSSPPARSSSCPIGSEVILSEPWSRFSITLLTAPMLMKPR